MQFPTVLRLAMAASHQQGRSGVGGRSRLASRFVRLPIRLHGKKIVVADQDAGVVVLAPPPANACGARSRADVHRRLALICGGDSRYPVDVPPPRTRANKSASTFVLPSNVQAFFLLVVTGVSDHVTRVEVRGNKQLYAFDQVCRS